MNRLPPIEQDDANDPRRTVGSLVTDICLSSRRALLSVLSCASAMPGPKRRGGNETA
jgi:hypothetical protein